MFNNIGNDLRDAYIEGLSTGYTNAIEIIDKELEFARKEIHKWLWV